jgi:putative endonuclease
MSYGGWVERWVGVKEKEVKVCLYRYGRHGYKGGRMKQFYVYVLASRNHGVLYTGVTSNLPQRIRMHKNRMVPGFTKRYKVHKLVYFEKHNNAMSAIHREKCIKKWYREWKIVLIEKHNPGWRDLSEDIISIGSPLARG